ncbi:HAD family hydrolase [Halorientalis pallida]|uniref:HAD family hydrolase n=1 Tax=Halorientalis pallida TaxID=2479928 RepID=A0A498L0Q2_9EURY|nr:HAD family hydrolase [Halorientalis pallida]RXK49303.1 HAD family hydrolase [Halorientalis pallida]
MTEYEAVFFDIGGVIVSLPSIRQGYVDFLREFAAERDLEPEPALETWRERLGEHFKSAEGTEYMSAAEGYHEAFQAIVDGDLAREAWEPGFEAATKAAMETEPNVVETIQALDDAGFYLGIVSDIDTREAHRMLDQFGIDDAFDGVTTSEAVGYKKPDQRMFEDALGKADIDPARGLMIGDRYDHDMQGGTEAGLGTVAYNGTAFERAAEVGRDGYRVVGEDAIDYAVEDHRTLLEVVEVE